MTTYEWKSVAIVAGILLILSVFHALPPCPGASFCSSEEDLNYMIDSQS